MKAPTRGTPAPPGGVLVDTDPAIGLRFRDIDDALAIHALAAGGRLAGLTSTYGNAPLAKVHPVAVELGRRYGVPVHRGARAPGDEDTPAVEALVAHRGPVLGIGPCTNLAAALARGARWEGLVLLGGTTRRGPNLRYLHLTELNFALDPPAAQRAVAAAPTLFPMELCRRVVFTAAQLGPLPPELRRRCASWVRIAPWLTGTAGFHPWDLLPAMFLLHPGLFTVERRELAVAGTPLRKGRLREGPHRVELAVEVDGAGLRARWEALGAGPRG